jgi:hypothetical protein
VGQVESSSRCMVLELGVYTRMFWKGATYNVQIVSHNFDALISVLCPRPFLLSCAFIFRSGDSTDMILLGVARHRVAAPTEL